MSEPEWINKSVLLAVHNELLNRFGGSPGIRDEGLQESAVHRPQQLFHYGEPTVFELAAAYAAGLIKNHAFIDGNKRSGYMAAYVFLGLNGYVINVPETEVVLQTLALATGEISEANYAAWLEQSCA